MSKLISKILDCSVDIINTFLCFIVSSLVIIFFFCFQPAFKNFQSVINREVVLDIKRKRIFLSIATYENDDYTGDGGISTFTVQVNIVQSDFDGVKIFPDSIQVEILDNDSPPKLGT